MGNNPTNLASYFEIARSTAIYPEEARFVYPALGLPDEVGEFIDVSFPRNGKVDLLKVAKEMGDVIWYWTNVGLDANIDLHDVIMISTGGLRCDTFEDFAFQRLRAIDRRSPYLKLTVYSGLIAGVAKKAIRDGYDVRKLPVTKRVVVADSLRSILVALCEICEKHGLTLDEVARYNNKKLTDRQERGKLQGDGDDR